MEKNNQPLSILTGATAGATESFVVVPFELIKIRLQDRASAGKYNGMIDVATKIIKAEGPLAMYNGLESTLWRHIIWNAGYFGVIFQVKELLPKATTKKSQTVNDLVAGAIGGTFGTMLNTPYVLPLRLLLVVPSLKCLIVPLPKMHSLLSSSVLIFFLSNYGLY